MLTNNILGLVFPNSKDSTLPEFTHTRAMGSVPFAGRYRLIDFTLSSMTNAGIQKVGVMLKENYLSLMAHVAGGQEWDLSRKRDGITVFPPYGGGSKMSKGRMDSLYFILDYLENSKEDFVVMANCDIVRSLDYGDIVAKHIAANADVTAVYQKLDNKGAGIKDSISLTLNEENRATKILVDDYTQGSQNVVMNVFVISRKLLVEMVKAAHSYGYKSFERDILPLGIDLMNIVGYEFTEYCPKITDLKSFYDANMALIDPEKLKITFPKRKPVYTRVRDDAPTIHSMGSKVKNSIIADGCVIEGEVENCVIFRGVTVKKGAKVKNCVILKDGIINENSTMNYVITDRLVVVSEGQTVSGSENYPVFVGVGATI